ncbi:O-succinylbenzoate synthase [Brachybacterium vulturis]|uniref:o-succinylbenzoate synthase n=1 Tax=Brachybacterium vulturis TaxID=2017484 RepID=A0A291GM42_9MICO|nr:o-succinylbenzoate synthase [Brachybacterium vulturis]ATG51247.1 O-succinylbenzoate synthase [Brachybacterium vulturis]
MQIPSVLRDLGIDEARAWSIPMTTRFRRITERDGLLLHGPAGWAEFSPFWDYDAAESATWLRAALADATTERPAPLRAEVPVNVTIPVVPPMLAHRLARVGGATTAKVKVADPGVSIAEDASRLEAVRDAMGPAARLRIDANAAWTREEALTALPVLDRAAGGLEYAEQPCAALEDLAAVRRALDIPIAADESVRRAEDPLRVVRAEAADLLVIKVQPLGGVQRCLELVEQAGLPVVVSSALESSVGLSAGIALAAALAELPYACGLGTAPLLTGDLVAPPLHAGGGMLPVGRRDPAPELLERHAAGPELTARWQERLTACTDRL